MKRVATAFLLVWGLAHCSDEGASRRPAGMAGQGGEPQSGGEAGAEAALGGSGAEQGGAATDPGAGAGGEAGVPIYSEPPVCLHDACSPGSYLDPRCSPCTAAVCEEDDLCCGMGWDETCVLETLLYDVCSCDPESRCDDLADDDLDQLVDCADPDCTGSAACTAGEGVIGAPCARHSDCAAGNGKPLCRSEPRFAGGFCSGYCEQGADDCGPGTVCVTEQLGYGEARLCRPACDPGAAVSECRPYYLCDAGDSGGVCRQTSEQCDVPGDDDGDGALDCADQDCVFEAACQEDCENELDDTGEGLIDCEDGSCFNHPACDAPVCDAPETTASTCVMLGGFVECNPISGAGCGEDEVCDLALGGYRCHPRARGAKALCDSCSPQGCGPGTTCIGTGAPGPEPTCWRFCCADEDCGTGGRCNKNITTQIIGQFSHIGVCAVDYGH